MSDAKRSVLHQLGPRWLVAPTAASSADGLTAAFGRVAPRLVDLGGGTGEATRAWAEAHPDHDVLAIELHRPGIVRLVRDLEAEGPPNVRVVEDDGTALLSAWAAGELAGLRVLFPDPWPKRRHVGRRLVDPGFVRQAADLLRPGALLHLATDWDDYADQMRAALATEARWHVRADITDGADVDPNDPLSPRWRSNRPARPVTAYEQRGLDAGRTITDLVALRR